MKTDKIYFKLYACCLLVKGAKRSMICDVQRNDYQMIPNDLFEILDKYKDKSIIEIKEAYENKYNDIIEEYFTFLIDNEFVFLCDKDELEFFPTIDLIYDVPAHITNAIIDLNESSQHDFNTILTQLEDLGCKHIQIRVYSEKTLLYFDSILTLLENTRILSIELIIRDSFEITEQNLQVLIDTYPRIQNIIVHSCSESRIVKIDKSKIGNIIFVSQIINDKHHCGIISPDYFSINIQTFSESQKYNTCLNKKIGIDYDGEIKNCPSMSNSYGNIKDTLLKDAIQKIGFKDTWYINKDQIEVCKDCEFRHICTDCRVYITNPNNNYSKPIKCSYNPYIAEWGKENATDNPLHGK